MNLASWGRTPSPIGVTTFMKRRLALSKNCSVWNTYPVTSRNQLEGQAASFVACVVPGISCVQLT